ncbi:MAG TPA: hypothetical protein VIF60_10110 [Burkholderiaceae bacterium]
MTAGDPIYFRSKAELSPNQGAILDAAASNAPSHEVGPWKNWHNPVCQEILCVPSFEPEGDPLGILQLGGFPDMLMPEWWILPEHRHKGIGHRVAYDFGCFVRQKGGVRMARPNIVGDYANTSREMIDQFYKGLIGLSEL